MSVKESKRNSITSPDIKKSALLSLGEGASPSAVAISKSFPLGNIVGRGVPSPSWSNTWAVIFKKNHPGQAEPIKML
jgi:hypothetical protein